MPFKIFNKNYIPVILGTTAALVMAQSPRANALSPIEISKIAKSITVLVQGPAAPGSGVIIAHNDNTYTVLTAYHVVNSINPGEEAYITTPDGKRYRLDSKNIKHFNNKDLAEVTFSSSTNYPVATIGDPNSTEVGGDVYVAGFPLPNAEITDTTFTLSAKGKITSKPDNPYKDGYSIMYSCETLQGMSGGPVLNAEGQLIAIHGRGITSATQVLSDGISKIKSGYSLGILVGHDSISDSNQSQAIVVQSINPTDSIPKDAEYYKNQGNSLYSSGNYRSAIDQYTLAIAINPSFANAYYDRGNCYLALGNNQKAINDYNQAIAINPNFTEAYTNREIAQKTNEESRIKPETSNDTLAKYDLRQGKALYGGYAAAGSALTDYDKNSNLNSNNVESAIKEGNARFNFGDYQGALEEYNIAINLNPNYAKAYNNRGVARQALKDNLAAESDYENAIRLDPNYADAYNNKGVVRDDASSIKDFNKAISLNSNYANAYYNRASVRRKLGDKQGAVEDYKKAQSLFKSQGNIEGYNSTVNKINTLIQ